MPRTTSTVSLPCHRNPEPVGVDDVIGLRVEGTSRTFPLDAGGIAWLIGSGPSCEIELDDAYVSRLHAALLRRKARLTLVDKSKNGTLLGNTRIVEGYVHDRARIQCGMTTLIAFSASSRYEIQPTERLVGTSVAIRKVVEVGQTLAQTRAHALLVGEMGTGKQTLAAAIHQWSRHATGPYVVVDCESGDAQAVVGQLSGAGGGEAVVAAAGGTLVIVGVELLSQRLWPRLVRLLARTDGDAPQPARVIWITRDLRVLRSPEWAWLRKETATVELPPLRERLWDIPALASLFVRELRQSPPPTIHKRTLAALVGHDWPGNVAELRRAIRHAVARSDGAALDLRAVWPSVEAMEAALRAAVTRAIETSGSLRQASEQLGLPWSTFRELTRRWDVIR